MQDEMSQRRQEARATDRPQVQPSEGSASTEEEARRQAVRDNARRVLRASGVPEMLRALNREALKGRGTFQEYDSGVIFRWGTGYTRRHIWIDVDGNTIRFRYRDHLPCRAPEPRCDGEYHTFPAHAWGDRAAIEREIRRAFERPVAEASED
jgi:hypothetical protein